MGVSIREAECQLDAKLFLDEYLQWDIEGPHCPIILHSMFLHATREGQKEADSSAEATGKAYPGQIPKKACLPYSWWAIGPPGKKSGTYTMRYIC